MSVERVGGADGASVKKLLLQQQTTSFLLLSVMIFRPSGMLLLCTEAGFSGGLSVSWADLSTQQDLPAQCKNNIWACVCLVWHRQPLSVRFGSTCWDCTEQSSRTRMSHKTFDAWNVWMPSEWGRAKIQHDCSWNRNMWNSEIHQTEQGKPEVNIYTSVFSN